MQFNISALSVAIVTDSMIGFGGSDRLIQTLLKIFPKATIYTSIVHREKYPNLSEVNIKTSFLQPLRSIARYLSVLYPFAFEQFNFDGYDLVVLLTAGPAKNIITPLRTKQVTIILTPPRHLWNAELNISGPHRVLAKLISTFLSHYLRIVDLSGIKRNRNLISISNYIKEKVWKIYGVDSEVIYPGVSKFWFEKIEESELNNVKNRYELPKNFVLLVSRLYKYKNIDVAIRAATKCNANLIIVGNGPEYKHLNSMIKDREKIRILTDVNDVELRAIYYLADAFIFTAKEDFGYVSVEAMAQGTPVICFGKGGSIEIVKEGVSGNYYIEEEELVMYISNKIWNRYNNADVKKVASNFKEDHFIINFETYIKELYGKEK